MLAARKPLQLKTKNLTLVAHVPKHLLALIESSDAYHKTSGTHIADGVREFLLGASPRFLAELRVSTAPDPWKFGFAIVHTEESLLVGMCGFTDPPDPTGVAEIAYSIAPAYQGEGYATGTAMGAD
jgi:ribosomal-protein-alanine N-acetyltransferase